MRSNEPVVRRATRSAEPDLLSMERVERALCGARGVRGEVRRSADDDDDDKRPDTLSFGVCRAPFGLPCGRANVGREAVRVAVEGSALSSDAVLMLSESCEWRSLGLVCGDTAFIVDVVVAVDIDVVDVTGADSRRAARGCGGDTCTRTGDTGGASASVLTRNSTPVQSASSQPPRPLLLPAPLLLRLSKRPLVSTRVFFYIYSNRVHMKPHTNNNS